MSALALGSIYYTEFSVRAPINPNQGLPVNADSLPTIQLIRNGTVDTAVTPVVINLTTGRYSVTFTAPAAWSILDNIDVVILATIYTTAYRNLHENVTIVAKTSTPYNPSSTVTRQDVEMVYGASNIFRWADADNDQDATKITDRIAWAINKADMYVEGKLSLMYLVPMEPMPSLLVDIIAQRAGAVLYLSPRALAEGEDIALSNVREQMRQVDVQISDLLSGTLRFVESPTTCTMIPKVIKDECNQSPWLPYTQIPGPWGYIPDSLDCQVF